MPRGRGRGRGGTGRGRDSSIGERSDVHTQEQNIATPSPSQLGRGRDSPIGKRS